MLKKEYRIRKQKDFDRIFGKEGAFFSQGFISVKIIENDLPYSRFGFIVSNKVSKKAVRRNRTKRLLREAVRGAWPDIISGIDVVLIARSDLSDKKLKEVNPVVDMLLKRSGLLIKK